jgi:SNF2 family DNA or RNA helicase
MSLSLRKYQEDGVKFFLNSKDCLLADDMGLGKTVQVAAAIHLLYMERKIGRVLIVVPKALARQWRDELSLWASNISARLVTGDGPNRRRIFEMPYPLIIATYEQVRAEIECISELPKFSVVVLDEAQKIKNKNSATHKACTFIPRKQSWALTGTPVENSIEDFQAILNFVLPLVDSEGASTNRIHSLTRDHFLRRKQEEVLGELPKMIKKSVLLDLSLQQEEEYREALSARASLSSESSMSSIFELINRLKQVCNKSGDSQFSSKLEALLGILSDLHSSEHKVLVFSQYVETLEWLRGKTEIPSSIYSGSLSEQEKISVLQDFKDSPGPRVLFMSLKAGAVGLNIQEASHVVLFDRWWNPSVEAQAIARAQRYGRQGRLQVFEFLVKNTIEEKIQKIIDRKKELFEQVVNEAPKMSLDKMSKSELLDALYGVA